MCEVGLTFEIKRLRIIAAVSAVLVIREIHQIKRKVYLPQRAKLMWVLQLNMLAKAQLLQREQRFDVEQLMWLTLIQQITHNAPSCWP